MVSTRIQFMVINIEAMVVSVGTLNCNVSEYACPTIPSAKPVALSGTIPGEVIVRSGMHCARSSRDDKNNNAITASRAFFIMVVLKFILYQDFFRFVPSSDNPPLHWWWE